MWQASFPLDLMKGLADSWTNQVFTLGLERILTGFGGT